MPRFIRLLVVSRFVSQEMNPRTVKTKDPLLALTSLIEAGQITPLIERTCPLSAVPEAIRYLAGGKPSGRSSSPCRAARAPESRANQASYTEVVAARVGSWTTSSLMPSGS
jgi:hypothetical protein